MTITDLVRAVFRTTSSVVAVLLGAFGFVSSLSYALQPIPDDPLWAWENRWIDHSDGYGGAVFFLVVFLLGVSGLRAARRRRAGIE